MLRAIVEFRTSLLAVLLVVLWLVIPGVIKCKAQTSLPMDPNQWIVGICGGAEKPVSTGTGGIQFTFKLPTDGCDGFLAHDFQRPVAISGVLTSNLTVQADPGVTFGPAFEPGNTCPTPATTRFAIYAKGWDKSRNCLPGSNCANERWYAESSTDVDPMTGANTPPTAYPLANGSAMLSKLLTPGSGSGLSSDPDNCHWTNVYGECADSDATHITAFNSAIGSVVRLAQVMGAGCFAAHGVWASGPATFQLYSFGWQ